MPPRCEYCGRDLVEGHQCRGQRLALPRTQQQNAGRVGRVAEHLAAAWLLRHNNVYVSIMPDPSDCDLVVLFPDGDIASIQVKAAYWSSRNCMMANCASSRGQLYRNVEYLLIVDMASGPGDHFYLIPTTVVRERSHLRLARYQRYRCFWSQTPQWIHRAELGLPSPS